MFQLRATQFEQEKEAFLTSVTPSLRRRLLGRFGGQRDTDPITNRYKTLAAALQRAVAPSDNVTLSAFMESEARTQRTMLLSTLQRIRTIWATSQGLHAEPDEVD